MIGSSQDRQTRQHHCN